jgi:hypothetical protein
MVYLSFGGKVGITAFKNLDRTTAPFKIVQAGISQFDNYQRSD